MVLKASPRMSILQWCLTSKFPLPSWPLVLSACVWFHSDSLHCPACDGSRQSESADIDDPELFSLYPWVTITQECTHTPTPGSDVIWWIAGIQEHIQFDMHWGRGKSLAVCMTCHWSDIKSSVQSWLLNLLSQDLKPMPCFCCWISKIVKISCSAQYFT